METTSLQQYLYRMSPADPNLLTRPFTPEEIVTYQRHVAFMEEQVQRGRLFVAGRTQVNDARTMGIAIFLAASDDAAEAFMRSDPFVSSGMMNAEVFPFRVAFFNAAARAADGPPS